MPWLQPAQNEQQAGWPTVIISEVAWAGTAASSADEWIELYNPSATTVDLTGWRLSADDGSPDILLQGEVAPDGYFLLERTDDETVKDIAADQIYTGALANTGERLTLYAPDGTVVDTANRAGAAWPAGTSAPPASMERIGLCADEASCWGTNNGLQVVGLDANGNPVLGTPRQQNSTWVLPTPTPGPQPTATPTPSPSPTASPTLLPSPTVSPTPSPVPSPSPTMTLTPAPTATMAAGAIRINEIAWAGTRASSADEWIELYNTSSTPVDLTGWKLAADDGSPLIWLEGVVPPAGYFLLERSDDNTVADVAADQIYSGSLANGGEVLRLYAPDGRVIDQVAASDGWPAGDSASRASMERKGAGWMTFAGTPTTHDAGGNAILGSPKQANWALNVTATPSPSPTPQPTQKTGATRATTYAPVTLNAIGPRPARDWNGDGRIDRGDEFIEIINAGAQPVSLRNWKVNLLPGNVTYRLPPASLAPGRRVLLLAGFTGLYLPDAGATVRLLDDRGRIVDAFTYPVISAPGVIWCRQPFGYGLWRVGCAPTWFGVSMAAGSHEQTACALADTAPQAVQIGECRWPDKKFATQLARARWLIHFPWASWVE